jgi:hypothetical protein
MSSKEYHAGVGNNSGILFGTRRNIKQVYTNPKISVGAKALYGVLSSYADKEGVCFPSVNRMATDLDKSTRQISRWIEELVEAKIIVRYWSESKSIHTRLLI